LRQDDRSRQGGHHTPSIPTLEEVWKGYLHGGYFESGKLRPEYVRREEMTRLARGMTRLAQGMGRDLTANQLRRFFGHARAIEAKLLAKTASWEQVEVEFRRLDVAAADAFNKSDSKIPALFHDFIRRNVATVGSEEDFLKGFMPHFEALVGFGTEFFKNERR
jgi:CRISPR type III-A-associated protein Csm2